MKFGRAEADIVCRALLAIVAVLRRAFDLPEYRNISIVVVEKQPDDCTTARIVG